MRKRESERNFLLLAWPAVILLSYRGSKVLRETIVQFTNSVDPDEAAHDEPPYRVLQCFQYDL